MNKKNILIIALAAAVVLTILICSVVLVAKFIQFRNSKENPDGNIEAAFSDFSGTAASSETSAEETAAADEGTLQGYVLDAASYPLENVEITLVSTSDGTEMSTLTDQDGRYQLQLAEGAYRLLAVCEGYQEYRMDGILIGTGAVLKADPIILKPDMDYEAKYYDYIQQTLKPKYGLAGMNRFDTKSDGIFGSVSYVPSQVQGIVSADIADYTGDSIPDLLTAVFTQNDENYIWKLQLYICTDGEVTKTAGYDFSVDRHSYFVEKAIRVEAVGGYIAVSSAYCAYEGLSSDYVFLTAATLKPALTLHLYSHAGDTLTVNGKESYENIDANIRKAVQNLSVAHSLNQNKSYIELNLTGARCLTEYLRKDEIITPKDKTNLREKLGVSYSTAFIDTEVPTTEEPREILDTLHYDVDNDGKKEKIEVFRHPEFFMMLYYRVYQEDGSEEQYEFVSGTDSFIRDCIIYDGNIGKTYIGYVMSGGGMVYPTLLLEGMNYTASARAMLDYSETMAIYIPCGAEYSINDRPVPMEKVRAYFNNIEILYSYRDPEQSALGNIDYYFIDFASPTEPATPQPATLEPATPEPATPEPATLPEPTIPPETMAEDPTEPETAVPIPME